MDPAFQQVCQRPVDGALAFDAGEAREQRGRNLDREMAFAAPVMAGVAAVRLAVVPDQQMGRVKIRPQSPLHLVRHRAHPPAPLSLPTTYIGALPGKDERVRAKGGQYPGDRPCAEPGCPEAGEYRAPRHRPGSALAPPSGPPEWQYFCLAHVRAFNDRWNYFEGLDAEAIFAEQTPYPQWDRATRAFAHNVYGKGAFEGGPDRVEDALGVLRWKTAARAPAADPLALEERQALATLGLADSATLADIKATYRRLARRYHPDANAGDRTHEARFQRMTEAYDRLAASPRFANRRQE
jgi:hypothetical protein